MYKFKVLFFGLLASLFILITFNYYITKQFKPLSYEIQKTLQLTVMSKWVHSLHVRWALNKSIFRSVTFSQPYFILLHKGANLLISKKNQIIIKSRKSLFHFEVPEVSLDKNWKLDNHSTSLDYNLPYITSLISKLQTNTTSEKIDKIHIDKIFHISLFVKKNCSIFNLSEQSLDRKLKILNKLINKANCYDKIRTNYDLRYSDRLIIRQH